MTAVVVGLPILNVWEVGPIINHSKCHDHHHINADYHYDHHHKASFHHMSCWIGLDGMGLQDHLMVITNVMIINADYHHDHHHETSFHHMSCWIGLDGMGTA